MALSLTTPRSALRTINDDQTSINARKSVQPGKPGVRAPIEKLLKQSSGPLETIGTKNKLYIHTDPEPKVKAKAKERVITKAPEPLPEREVLNVFNPAEDLKPKTEKALIGVVERIRNWRPPCLFGMGRPDIDDDSDDENKEPPKDNMADLFPPPKDFTEDTGNLSDLHIPSVDIEDLPLPYLDDSIDIEPNMGTLEIWNTSTPASLSPRSGNNTSLLGDTSDLNNSSVL